MDIFQFFPGYQTAIYNTGREPAFVMLLSFFITYIFTRGYTRIARITGWGSANFGGVHTHHMVFGLVIAFASGAAMFSLLPQQGPLLLFLAAAFGCGASLVLDEFALIFHLQDVYWEQEGRKSVDAVVLAVVFGTLFLLRATPFNADAETGAWLIALTIATNLAIVIVAALKGKIFMALFGVFVPTISLIGAIRLAEPNSLWARKFYGPATSKKNRRSSKRYEKYERTWRVRKEKAWDLIGGKTGRPPVKKAK